MRRLLAQFAGLALCASALSGCGMMGMSDGDSSPATARNAGDNTPISSDMTAAIRQAQLMRTGGDLEGATRILSQLMLGAPDDSRVVGEYGKLLVQEGHTADAIQFLRRAIELQPNDWTLYSALGVAYDQQSDQPNAKIAYEHALTMKPGEPAILNNFAMSRMLAGDRIAARTLMMQAQASGSSDPRIAKNLALLDATSPLAAPPATAIAATPRPPVATAAPRPPAMAHNDFPPAIAAPSTAPAAHGAPLPIAHGNTGVMMQDVPVDPLAGPVGRHTARSDKPAKLAKAGKPAKLAAAGKPPSAKPIVRNVAVNAPAKPAKTAKPQSHGIPALRMTADASKP